MSGDLPDQLRSDISTLQYYDSISIDLSGTWLHPLTPRLSLPSLTVIGTDSSSAAGAATRTLYDLARHGLRSRRTVAFTSGRDWTEQVRASCLLGNDEAQRQAHARPSPEDPELDTAALLGATRGGRLDVHTHREDLPVALAATLSDGPVDLWLLDDAPALAAHQPTSSALEMSPTALRRLSRERMCAVVVTLDWREVTAWQWERAADLVLNLVPSPGAGTSLTDGAARVGVPHL